MLAKHFEYDEKLPELSGQTTGEYPHRYYYQPYTDAEVDTSGTRGRTPVWSPQVGHRLASPLWHLLWHEERGFLL